ncbi:MAG: hypothetical protein GXO91_09680 [FCB group bacterium]|nr:hypothetical protein [FCB group bacterium]
MKLRKIHNRIKYIIKGDMVNKIFSLLFMLTLSSPAMAGMTYSGILQGRSVYNIENESQLDFLLPRARLILRGNVNDRVGFFIQSNMGSIIDVKLNYECSRFKTTFTLGRFLPNYTYYMPIHTGKLDFIDYPMLTSKTAPWRQIGFQSETRLTESVKFAMGLFNGALEPDNWADTTRDGKDMLLNLQGSFYLKTYWWRINAVGAETGDVEGSRSGIAVKYSGPHLKLIGEFLSTDFGDDTAGFSYYLQGGYNFPGKNVELLLRYDIWDPDKDASGDDSIRTTLGLNYYLSGQDAMFYFNLISIDAGQSANFMVFEVQYQILF